MTDHAELRAELEKELAELVARASKIDDDLSAPGDDDWEERATESENDEVLDSLGNATLKEIDQIKRAIHMIDKGTYGTCLRCHGKIARGRLEAIPYATTCAACATR